PFTANQPFASEVADHAPGGFSRTTFTSAPGNGFPSSSVTVPETQPIAGPAGENGAAGTGPAGRLEGGRPPACALPWESPPAAVPLAAAAHAGHAAAPARRPGHAGRRGRPGAGPARPAAGVARRGPVAAVAASREAALAAALPAAVARPVARGGRRGARGSR